MRAVRKLTAAVPLTPVVKQKEPLVGDWVLAGLYWFEMMEGRPVTLTELAEWVSAHRGPTSRHSVYESCYRMGGPGSEVVVNFRVRSKHYYGLGRDADASQRAETLLHDRGILDPIEVEDN